MNSISHRKIFLRESRGKEGRKEGRKEGINLLGLWSSSNVQHLLSFSLSLSVSTRLKPYTYVVEGV